MGLFTKDIKTMEDMFVHGLQDIYYAEQQITKALPKMIEKATNRDLAAGLTSHLEETNSQIERLQKVFQKLGKEPKAADCPAIDGLIKEADTITGEIDDKAVLDAAIVASAQAVEHCEIARYGTLIAWAGRTRPRRRRSFPDDEPQRGEGSQHQTQHRGASQGREQEGRGLGNQNCDGRLSPLGERLE